MGMLVWDALTCSGPYIEAVVSVNYDGPKDGVIMCSPWCSL